MTTILTPELIEKAAIGARLDFEKEFPGTPEWGELTEPERQRWRSRARAALQAVLPDVVEKCARACDRPNPHLANLSHTRERAYEECAASIRSLLNKEDKANG